LIRLHLVGFTADLKNLIFARRRGAKSGNFLVSIDARLRRTLEEVARLEGEARSGRQKASRDGEPRRTASKLSPKEIQNLLRRGVSADEVARLAETDVSWISRFQHPIVAERTGVVDAVKAGSISKPRLGPSAERVGDAIVSNLRERRINLPDEVLEEGWEAVLTEAGWHVTFRYLSRGQAKEATFTYDPETREVAAANDLARDIAWRATEEAAAQIPAKRNSRKAPGRPKESRRPGKGGSRTRRTKASRSSR
jgi:hypothetical protein